MTRQAEKEGLISVEGQVTPLRGVLFSRDWAEVRLTEVRERALGRYKQKKSISRRGNNECKVLRGDHAK